jgi:GAF domain-containing protein
LILESMGLVVPYHHVRVIFQHPAEIGPLADMGETVLIEREPLVRNEIYRSILNFKQPLTLEDVRTVPAWKSANAPSLTRSWMGIPLLNQHETVGLVALSRFALSPFTSNEKELGLVFTRYINTLLSNLAARAKKPRSFEKYFKSTAQAGP